ncbi:MAG: hypothetical protein LBT56_02825 [Prevotellaceae bacterium]|jgi:hypothetical protein|nr:hypothetical protein [Prevotellaceae bacterium]
MKKVVIISFIFVSAIMSMKAQSFETTVEMPKIGYQNAVSIDLPYTADDVEATLKKRFEASGLKGKSASKGFTEYKSVKFKEFSNEIINIYTKVDKNKQSKTDSKVYILVSLISDDVFCTSATCESLIKNVMEFENKLEPYVALYTTTVQFDKSTDDLKKAEKELRNLQDDGVSLQKDKDKILKKIEENTQKSQNKQNEIEMKQQIVHEFQLKKSKQESELPK